MSLASFTIVLNSMGVVERLKGRVVNWKVWF